MKRALITVLLAALSFPCEAMISSGNNLLLECAGNMLHQLACMYYISGVIDGVDLAQAQRATASKDRLFCLPATATQGQLQDIIVKSLSEHPELRHYPATYFIVDALSRTFPCK